MRRRSCHVNYWYFGINHLTSFNNHIYRDLYVNVVLTVTVCNEEQFKANCAVYCVHWVQKSVFTRPLKSGGGLKFGVSWHLQRLGGIGRDWIWSRIPHNHVRRWASQTSNSFAETMTRSQIMRDCGSCFEMSNPDSRALHWKQKSWPIASMKKRQICSFKLLTHWI